MTANRYNSSVKRVLGVLGGQDMPLPMVKAWADSADFIIAADSGADTLHAVGVRPNVAIGDFDSALQHHLAETVVHSEDQDNTDCDKLLRYAAESGITHLTLVAIEGDQLDHMLATLHSAARSPVQVRAALRTGIGWILNSGDRLMIPTQPGRRVSLLPLTETEGATLRGVEWPLEHTSLSPLGVSSISNRATSESVEVGVFEGAAFLFVEFPVGEMPVWE